MLFNYIKIAFRNLFKYKAFSLINIFGLAIGMTCCFMILLWVLDELSFDRFHENSPNLYRTVVRVINDNGTTTSIWGPTPMGPALKEEMPEVVDFARWLPAPQLSLHHEDSAFNEKIIWVDPNFFQMFSFPAIEGELEGALNEPLSLIITRRIARKYFGTDENIVGKTLKMNNKWEYKIKAVIEDVPANSHLEFDVLAPFTNLKYVGWKMDNWLMNNTITYLQLQEGVSYQEFNQKIEGYLEAHMTKFTFSEKLFLQPLTEVHLYSDFAGDRAKLGNITHVYILSIIAAFILLIACINFMNLSTARSANRVKEIGIRKTVGAQRSHLIAQFYGESIFLSVVALVAAIVLVILLLPSFNTLSGKQLALDLTGDPQVVFGIGLITFFTGIIAGSYPAFFLSAFKPARVLQGSSRGTAKSTVLRKTLVVVQFSLSVLLIISTTIVHNQLQFIKNKDVGYDKQNVMMIPMKSGPFSAETHETLKNELLQNSKILGVTASSQNPTNMEIATIIFSWPGKNPEDQILIHYNSVTIDYLETLKLEVKEGRGYSPEIASDRLGALVLNEEAVKVMGLENPIGETITAGEYKLKVIGTVKNFHFQPVHKKIEPMIIATGPIRGGFTIVKLHPDEMAETVGFVKKTWDRIYPTTPFDYHFLDEDYDRLYRAEERMGTLLNYFSVLAVFIACLGLFGLASFTTEQRTKEVGIRKVLGATTTGLIALLCKDFLKLVLIANIIAWPLAYYAMTNWLQDFAYRITISWLIFLMAAVLSVLIAMFTVSFQAAKAALANPVKSLRYE
ncbi:MAG: FtsX-like permease family protein [Proteobacteria bacterium]|nr:FtsX-like permease family protein [Pseudomonadota bacterium]